MSQETRTYARQEGKRAMQEQMTSEEVRKVMAGEYVPPRPAMRPCPDSLTIELPIPSRLAHPNTKHAHWSVLHKARTKQKEDGHYAALAMLRCERYEPPRWERATLRATFHKPGNRAKKSDDDNLIGWCKAYADSLQSAGIIVNDQGLVWLPPIELLGKEAGDERKLVLVVTCLRSNQ